uniref:Uncharacterized protein n=1 Tax=Neisseria lactamica TaxID=486 RepID=A7IS73_NEILA|nr:hypothetical protein [Neisseria lactamica]
MFRAAPPTRLIPKNTICLQTKYWRQYAGIWKDWALPWKPAKVGIKKSMCLSYSAPTTALISFSMPTHWARTGKSLSKSRQGAPSTTTNSSKTFFRRV